MSHPHQQQQYAILDTMLRIYPNSITNPLLYVTATVFETCDIVILAVKPNLFPVVVREISQCNGPANQLVLSVMSGVTIADLEKVIL